MDAAIEWIDREMRRHLTAAEVKTFFAILRKLERGLEEVG
jgi:hypothetical protein